MTDGALDGILVIDLTRVLGGPYCTQILGDHGAEVVKVEPPQGDEVRDWGPPFNAARDASYFVGVNRNKRSLGLDLAQPEGRDVLLRLLERADVLIENYKPGAMEKWGWATTTFWSRASRAWSTAGSAASAPTGRWAATRATTPWCRPWSGCSRSTACRRAGRPGSASRWSTSATGLYAAIAVLMALSSARARARGQFIDMTLYDAGIALMHPHVANYVMSGRLPALTGNAHPNICPYDRFPRPRPCRCSSRSATIAPSGACAPSSAGPEVADDPRYATNGDRLAHRTELTVELARRSSPGRTARRSPAPARRRRPAGPVRDVAEVWVDGHTRHRAMAAERRARGLGLPIKLSRTPARSGAIRRASASTAARSWPSSASKPRSTACCPGTLVEQRRRWTPLPVAGQAAGSGQLSAKT